MQLDCNKTYTYVRARVHNLLYPTKSIYLLNSSSLVFNLLPTTYFTPPHGYFSSRLTNKFLSYVVKRGDVLASRS